MTETFDSYRTMIKNLQDKIKELREKNLKLEERLVKALSSHSQDFHLTISITPNDEKIYDLITNFINSSKTELIVASKSISLDILNMIIEKLDYLETISIITTERNQMYGEDTIQSFDILASIPKIHHIINPNINSSFIIKDKTDILLVSGILKKSELITKLNTGFKISDKAILEKYLKFYTDHLPSFMR